MRMAVKSLFPNQTARTPFLDTLGVSAYSRAVISEETKAIAQAINIAVFRSVAVIAGEIGSMDWQIVDAETGEVVDSSKNMSHDHVMGRAIRDQWQRSGQPFFYLWTASLLLSGKTFIEPVNTIFDESRHKPPVPARTYVGVNWLNPINVRINEPFGEIIGYTYSTPHGMVDFTKQEIVYDRLFNISYDNQGLSPTQLAISNVSIDYESKQTLMSFYVNDALPYAVITAKDTTSPGIKNNTKWWEELQSKLRSQHKGSANKYSALTVGEPLDVTVFDLPDLQKHTAYLTDIRNEIYTAFGVNPAVAGDTTGTPYKESDATYAGFYTQAVEPYVRRIERAINDRLIWYFDKSKKYRFEFVTTKFDSVKLNDPTSQANAKEQYMSGAITLNTYRQRIGATDDEGDEAWADMPDMVIVQGIPAPVPLKVLPELWKQFLPSKDRQAGLAQAEITHNNDSENKPMLTAPANRGDEQKGKEETKQSEDTPKDGKPEFVTFDGFRLKEQNEDELAEEHRPKALKELKQWLHFKRNKTKGMFTFGEIRPSVESYIKGQLAEGGRFFDIYTSACKMHSIKAIETTRSNYVRAVSAMIAEARAGNIDKKRFRDNMRNETKLTIARAYSDGLEDAGVFEEASAETKEAIRKLQLEPTPFVRDFAEKLFSKEGITDSEAASKPQLWFNGSISPVYSAGLLAGNENGMYEFAGTPGKKEPCDDCGRLIRLPDRHRLKAWDRRGLNMAEGAFVGQKTFCEGWQCKHFLKRTSGRAQGRF
jgi:phage portal protein BeeE